MSSAKTSAEFVKSFSTGWPEDQPDTLILSLTTQSGVTNFAMTAEQAQLVGKTLGDTAAHIAKSGRLAGSKPAR